MADRQLDMQILKEVERWGILSPVPRCRAIEHVTAVMDVSGRCACRAVGQHRSPHPRRVAHELRHRLVERALVVARGDNQVAGRAWSEVSRSLKDPGVPQFEWHQDGRKPTIAGPSD